MDSLQFWGSQILILAGFAIILVVFVIQNNESLTPNYPPNVFGASVGDFYMTPAMPSGDAGEYWGAWPKVPQNPIWGVEYGAVEGQFVPYKQKKAQACGCVSRELY